MTATASSPTFDLQSHSIHSDGELTPAEVVASAADAGVELLALTDHDSTAGVAEAIDAADTAGISVIPATEISVIDPAAQDLHLCAYGIDPNDRALEEQLQRSRNDREARAWRMVAALEELGYGVDEDALRARTAAGKTIGRPHIAQATVTVAENRQRLTAEELLDPTAFLVAYLIEGKPAFRDREGPNIEDAIALVHGAGGYAVWAHPFWDIEAVPEVLATLDRFAGLGLDGVEAFYVTHTEEQTRLLVEQAAARGLFTTGSSDFHGPGHRQFNRFRAFRTYGLAPNLGPLRKS